MKNSSYIPYNLKLKQRARELRNNPTAAEKKMWYEILKSEKLSQFNFHRQKPILNFIVDFYCSQLLLAIELDGKTHFEQKIYDEERTKKLNKYNVIVVRYFNDEVLKSVEWVYEDLLKKIKLRKKELNK